MKLLKIQKFDYKFNRLCIINLSIVEKVTYMDPSPCRFKFFLTKFLKTEI